MKNTYSALLMAVVLSCINLSVYSQQSQDTGGKQYKNIIRYNLSGAIISGIDKNIIFGYERVLKPNQSFSINIGKKALPKASGKDFETDSFTFNNDVKNTGFAVNADYRFYLRKENKYAAPHGIYIGPYMAYNQFKRENSWKNNDVNSQQKEALVKTDINIYTVGGELGYQFVLGKHIALDFVMVGPGYSYYKFNANISTNLTEEEKAKIRERVKDVLTEKFVGLNYILNNKDFDKEGSIRTWNIGFRYLIHIGYLF